MPGFLARCWLDFEQIFGQVFDQGFWPGFWDQKIQCTVLQGQRNTVLQGQKKKERKT